MLTSLYWPSQGLKVVKEFPASPSKTSMMWPSQNFLLYITNIIQIKVNELINTLKKYVNPPPFGDIYNMYKL